MAREEIVVRGTFRPIDIGPSIAPPPSIRPQGGGGGGRPGRPALPIPPDEGFAPPTVPPQLIPEIVVTGTRVSAPAFGIGTASAVSIGTIFGVVGGTLIAGILRDISQQRLDATMAELMVPERARPDTPLETIAPELIPEITVTGSQLDILGALLLQRIPQPPPLITPDTDPFVLVPILPRTMPTPVAVPDPIVEVPVAPDLQPAPAPFAVPSPFVSPIVSPSVRPTIAPELRPEIRPDIRPDISPETVPEVTPLPFPIPAPSPSIATNPLTGSRVSTVPSTEAGLRTSLRPSVSEAQAQCPPPPQCQEKEELEKPRDRCFKQLVKQGLFPSMDQSFDWVELDCLTGREI